MKMALLAAGLIGLLADNAEAVDRKMAADLPMDPAVARCVLEKSQPGRLDRRQPAREGVPLAPRQRRRHGPADRCRRRPTYLVQCRVPNPIRPGSSSA